jgi:hypothetical protein
MPPNPDRFCAAGFTRASSERRPRLTLAAATAGNPHLVAVTAQPAALMNCLCHRAVQVRRPLPSDTN